MFAYSILATVVGALCIALNYLAGLVLRLVPWSLHDYTVRRMLLAAHEKGIPELRAALEQELLFGKPYITRYRFDFEKQSYVKLEDFMRRLFDEHRELAHRYNRLRIITIELTEKSGDEIDTLLSNRL